MTRAGAAGTALTRQYLPRRVAQYLTTKYDILVLGVLRIVVADAVDRGHEQHRRPHAFRQDLCIMSRSTRHANMQTRRVTLSGSLQRVLKSCVHHLGNRSATFSDRHRAWPTRRFGHQRLQFALQLRQERWIGVAELEEHLGPAWDDAWRAGIQRDPPGRPHRPRPRHLGKSLADGGRKLDQRNARILADRHARSPRM